MLQYSFSHFPYSATLSFRSDRTKFCIVKLHFIFFIFMFIVNRQTYMFTTYTYVYKKEHFYPLQHHQSTMVFFSSNNKILLKCCLVAKYKTQRHSDDDRITYKYRENNIYDRWFNIDIRNEESVGGN